MDILEFARGPALQVAVYVLLAGSLWRLLGIVLLSRKPDYSEPRGTGGLKGALKVIWTRAFTAPVFKQATMLSKILGYTLHIGLFITIFFFVPHIVFFKDVFGVSWPGLPNNAVFFIGVITVGSALALLVRRMTHPVLRLISNFDDYFSWFVTILPVVSGLMMPIRLGVRYETLLAIHILSVCLLLVWLPFSKLAHTFLVFVSRGTTGAILERRGART
jgi:nitrate reductase gamma subunit